MSFFNIYQHVLPNAKAWRTTAATTLRRFIEGLSLSAEDVRDAYDKVYAELDPSTTQSLDEWDSLFGLARTALSTQERRDRLTAAWISLGGQSPAYLQGVLRAAGFDVYVHEWFSDANGTPRDPNTVIGTGQIAYIASADADASHADNDDAVAGRTSSLDGRLLINQTITGDLVPVDTADHKYIMYIGGVNFGDVASIPTNRRDEFTRLCLKICPAHLWIGVIAEYN